MTGFLSKEELYAKDFPWTIVDGRVYAIADFIPRHPGGPLIRRAIGEDATELFHTHHSSRLARATLARYEIGRLRAAEGGPRGRPFQELLNRRIAGLHQVPTWPVGEAIAAAMLALFAAWAALAYGAGWWRLNVGLAWFWWRHIDAGLHCTLHGDLRYSPAWHRAFLGVYGLLSRRSLEYYGGPGLHGVGLSQHLWHHVHTNDPARDPDWSTMTGMAWTRRHSSASRAPCHRWQCWYWLPVATLVEPLLELFQVVSGVLEATAVLLEPPSTGNPFGARLNVAFATWAEFLLNPGYQGAAFLFQPFWRALGTVTLARAVARLVLFPFSEVQHYMPEHMPHVGPVPARDPSGEGQEEEEWAVAQLRSTANLSLGNPLARLLDFLMFHGDSHQIEHHLWPAMSFTRYRRAAAIVRQACAEFGVPYHEVGYLEGYAKIWGQVREHARGPGAARGPGPAPATSWEGPRGEASAGLGLCRRSEGRRGGATAGACAAPKRSRAGGPRGAAAGYEEDWSEEDGEATEDADSDSCGPRPRRRRRLRGRGQDCSDTDLGPEPASASEDASPLGEDAPAPELAGLRRRSSQPPPDDA